jgi:enoyl reductase-like protein
MQTTVVATALQLHARHVLFELVDEYYVHCRHYHVRTLAMRTIVRDLVDTYTDDVELRAWVAITTCEDDTADPSYAKLFQETLRPAQSRLAELDPPPTSTLIDRVAVVGKDLALLASLVERYPGFATES